MSGTCSINELKKRIFDQCPGFIVTRDVSLQKIYKYVGYFQ